MAINIIEKGTKKAREWHSTCNKCGCKFSFNKEDFEVVHDQRDGDFFKVICPQCGKQSTMNVHMRYGVRD